MKTFKILFFVLILFAFSEQIHAQTPVNVYTGVSDPAAQGWTQLKLDAAVNTEAAPTSQVVGSGVLKLLSTNATDQFSQLAWYQTGFNLSRSVGYTIEVKAKVIAADKTGAFNIQGFDNEGKGFRIGILTDKITELTDPMAATRVVANGLVNSDGFHIFRFAFAPDGLVTVYRDGLKIGTFPVATFQFDNIIENGGFEEAAYPDFVSNKTMQRMTDRRDVMFGTYALQLNNNGEPTDGYLSSPPFDVTRTRHIPVKNGSQYDISITRRRTKAEPWGWRDMGTYYDTDNGSVGLKGVLSDGRGVAESGRDANPSTHMWAGCNDRFWLTHSQTITAPGGVKTIHFEFPTWDRDSGKKSNTTSLDNFTFREKMPITVGPTTPIKGFDNEPLFPSSYVNIIKNGGFEDPQMNNDGSFYEWPISIAGSSSENSNMPTARNDIWGGLMRLQTFNKPDDNVQGGHARSGKNSARWTTLGSDAAGLGFGNGWDNRLDFKVVLEPNKTYRFNFWYAMPGWGERCWLKLKLNNTCLNINGGRDNIWGHQINPPDQHWAGWRNADVIFTTTATEYILHLYDATRNSWWMNLYFDDFVLYEVTPSQPIDPQIVGKTNLIANGDFEDANMNNDGTAYSWALASQSDAHFFGEVGVIPEDEAFPMTYNAMWGTWLRLQDREARKFDDGVWGPNQGSNWVDGEFRYDTGKQWAHSGNKSLRFTFMDDWDRAQKFEGHPHSGDYDVPEPYRLNINFQKELEPNKTYTFVFWVKTSCWRDYGWMHIANGDIRVYSAELSNKYMNWMRQSVTFSTTIAHHTLRLFTEFGGWFNFYLDDLFLFEEDTYVPYVPNGASYLAFGKSTGTSSTNVELEYIWVDNTGPYAPDYIVDTPTKTWTEYKNDYGNNIIFKEGGQLTGISGTQTVNGVVKIEKTFTANQWYPIGFPFNIASVRSNKAGFDNYDLETYNPAGASGNKGDYWLRTYDGPTDKFNDYTYASKAIAKDGYALQVPANLNGATFTFTSVPYVSLSNSTEFDVLSGDYKLTHNPSVANVNVANDATNSYYAFEYTGQAGNYGLLASNYTVKPFESVVVANQIIGPLRTSLSVDVMTSLPAFSTEAIATEYYNLQGARVMQLQRDQIYIVKSIYESGRTEVVKLIWK